MFWIKLTKLQNISLCLICDVQYFRMDGMMRLYAFQTIKSAYNLFILLLSGGTAGSREADEAEDLAREEEPLRRLASESSKSRRC